MAVLAVDQGTSGTKAIVVADDGTILGLSEVPVHPRSPAPGAVEQDPAELLESVLLAGSQALRAADVPVGGLALANQGETVLAWDPATGRPLTPAIVWQDSRSQVVCDELREHADDIAARTGLVLDPYFSAPKMTWLRRSLTTQGVVTTTDTWLIHQLTGEFVTDATTASRSLLMDLDTVAWDPELVELFGLQDETLPRVVACDEAVGSTTSFGPGIPLAGLIVDQQAALLAEGCLRPGSAKCTFGTGAFLLANTGSSAPRSRHGLTTSLAWQTSRATQYCLDGQLFTAASAIHWLVDLGLLGSARELDARAADSSEGALFVPALAGLAAPWWRPQARASLTGLSLATGTGQVVRAVLEGLAAQVADLADAMAADVGARPDALRVDGGLTNSSILMQAQADVLQAPIHVYPSSHATALGAAACGRLAQDPALALEAAAAPWEPARTFEPQWSPDRAADLLGRWRAEAARVAALAGPG